ncbi:unnamed protein product [Kuraishia capsulata CBS 1993]|uniref:RRM domain-containing protein n=1 Tax=Kuraishia capsulata CBS 1993 TaxID=1382522 RepID=W6MP20_9ASCO|nr:uncharacterized protein KUCA_T00004363001 [Kuraishia capsulata CBS 1993]CDK28381.1 unnamed protein product [Kuraishia capsulata CBS 1993]
MSSSVIRIERLPRKIAQSDVVDVFIPFGEIKAVQINQQRGLVDVKYEQVEDAVEARLNMDGFLYFGQHLKVRELDETVFDSKQILSG